MAQSNRIVINVDVNAGSANAQLRGLQSNVTSVVNTINSSGAAGGKLGGNLTGAFTGATLAATGLIGVINGVVGAATAGASAVAGLFTNYADQQQQNVLTAGSLAGALNISFGEAEQATRRFQSELAEQVTNFGGDLSRTMDAASVSFDDAMKVFIDSGLSAQEASTKTASILARLSTVSAGDLSNVQLGQLLPNLIEGDLAASKDFFNAQIVSYIEDFLDKAGKTVESATPAERLAALDYALSRKLPDEVVAKMQGTVKGITAAFRSAFTNIDNGILSFDRDLSAAKGNQTVGQSFTRVVGKVFGKDGLFAQVGNILEGLGFTDASGLQGIANVLGNIGGFLDNVNTILGDVASTTSLDGVTFNFAEVGVQLATKFGAFVQRQLAALDNANTAESAANTGAGIGDAVGKIVYAAINQVDANTVAGIVSDAVIGAVSAGAQFIGTLLVSALRDAGEDFVAKSTDEYNTVANVLIRTINAIVRGAEDLYNKVASAVQAATLGGVKLPRLDINTMSEGSTDNAQRTNEMQAQRADTTTQQLRSGFGEQQGTTVRGLAAGTPNFVRSLVEAAKQEKRSSPLGSQVVVANTTETVLTRQQTNTVQQLVGGVSPGGNTFNFGGITVNAGSVTDPRMLAMQVMDEMQSMLAVAEQSTLTNLA